MQLEELALTVERLGATEKANTRRIDRLETQSAALCKLATSVEVLAARSQSFQTTTAEKLETISAGQEKIGEKVDALERAPGRKLDKLLWIVLTALASGVVGFLFARFTAHFAG